MSSLGQGLDGTAVPGVTSRLITSIADGEAVLRSAASLRMLGHAGPRCALPVPRSHLIVSFTFQDNMQPGDPQSYQEVNQYTFQDHMQPGEIHRPIMCFLMTHMSTLVMTLSAIAKRANQYSLRTPPFS